MDLTPGAHLEDEQSLQRPCKLFLTPLLVIFLRLSKVRHLRRYFGFTHVFTPIKYSLRIIMT